jgi:triosephosphate isomerase
VLAAETRGALARLDAAQKGREILFAYEPVWAIGDKGIPASADYADRQQALIRRTAAEVLGREPQVLYGGSVNPGNAAGLVAQPHVDGLFIGRSAWAAEGYVDILRRVAAAL